MDVICSSVKELMNKEFAYWLLSIPLIMCYISAAKLIRPILPCRPSGMLS